MILALLLVLVVTAAGALATYCYDAGASLATRLCTGACIGLAAFGLIGFVLASLFGLTPLTIGVATVVTALPFFLLLDPDRREQIDTDLKTSARAVRRAVLHPTVSDIGYFLYYAIAAVLMGLIFDRAMIVKPEGIYTGVLNNFGDLPFHLSVVSGFAFGNNYPPEDPTYAGVRFTYPFLTDFISAVFVRCGANLRESLFIENFVLAVSFVGVLHRWAWELLRDRLAALLTPLLVLLNGGFGWLLLFKSEQNDEGLYGLLKQGVTMLKHLPPSFTVIPETSWRWGNAISALLLPQRGILLGLPLAVIVFTQWWIATRPEETAEIGAERPSDGKSKAATRKVKGKKARDWESQKPGREGTDHVLSAGPGLFLKYLRPTPTARMIAAGLIAGLLPLVHAHTFVVVIGVGGCLALWLNWRAWTAALVALLIPVLIIRIAYPGAITAFDVKAVMMSDFIRPLVAIVGVALVVALWFLLERWPRRLWFCFFLCALLLAVPQMKWSTSGSAVNAANFFAWEFGWDSGKESTMSQLRMVWFGISQKPGSPDVVWFWLKNTGLFIPLLLAAILWRGKDYLVSRRLLLFYLPFTLCFVIPNMVKLAPWIWDNVKVLFYWWVASAPLVALLLSRLWKSGTWRRPLAVALFACLTLAGALDVASIVLRSGEYQIFDPFGVRFAEVVKQQTEPRSTVVHAPVHNTPVFLSGRRSLMGYPGHIWTHGLVFADRESEIKRIYAGAPDAELLLKKYQVDYAVVGPLEKLVMPVNEQFFMRFQKVGQSGDYRLYKIFH